MSSTSGGRVWQALATWVPSYLELGWAYKLYMVALTVFATNAINILAGVNGLEVPPGSILSFSPSHKGLEVHSPWMPSPFT